MIILRKKKHKIKGRVIRVRVGQLLRLFPEIKLLIKAAKKDYKSINKASNSFPSSLYYCGITNNPKRRQSEHNALFLQCIDVRSRDKACLIEMTMEGLGFDTGRRSANGGNPDSIYIYIYRKIKGVTIEG